MTPLYLSEVAAFVLLGSTLGAVLTGLIVARPLRNAVHREQARWLDAEHANARVTAAHRKTEARWVRALDDLRVARDERDAAWAKLGDGALAYLSVEDVRHAMDENERLKAELACLGAAYDSAKTSWEYWRHEAELAAVERDEARQDLARWKHPRMPNGRFLGRVEASVASDHPADAKSRSDHVQARLNEVSR